MPGAVPVDQDVASVQRPRSRVGAQSVREVLAQGAVRSVYQPIVHLATGAVVGYEALARGPQGSPLERPDRLFEAARSEGLLPELDWACRLAALEGALAAGLRPPSTLFLNVEPETLGAPPPPGAASILERARSQLRVVVEVTERSLTARPAELLDALASVAERGWGIAVDDVGADPRSLALMPFLAPSVIKLDLRLVQEQPGAVVAEVVNAVNAEAERSGSVILAEGIETEEHLQMAFSLGAELGQGWLFGRPAPLAPAPPCAGLTVPIVSGARRSKGRTPLDVVSGVRSTRAATKRLLLAISFHLERQAAGLGGTAVVISTFQDDSRFTPLTRQRYARLAESAAFVGALGAGMPIEPVRGVRGASLDEAERLRGEWDVAVIAPHFAAALVARDLGDDGPEHDRRFDYVLTYDRDLVVDVAASLMAFVTPAGTVGL